MVLYFSGTGNSRYVAQMIANITGDYTVDLGSYLRDKEQLIVHSDVPFVFVTPTHGWQIPKLISELIEKAELNGSKKIYFVMTCGDDIGNAGEHLEKLCRNISMEYMGVFGIVMPENYIAMFPVPDASEAREIIERAHPSIRQAAANIKMGSPFPRNEITRCDKLKSGIVNRLFTTFFMGDFLFRKGKECIACGRCADLCPVNNIVMMRGGHPRWKGKCIHCMACINGCTMSTIEYAFRSKGKPRYFLEDSPPLE
jgi:flavodoxin/ferredoxin